MSDIFSAVVNLFIIFTGHPPFGQALSKDTYYQPIMLGRTQQFWKPHFEINGEQYYSESFKNFVFGSLSDRPSLRLTIPEIKQHEWFKGEVATLEEVQMEMERRRLAKYYNLDLAATHTTEFNAQVFAQIQVANRGDEEVPDFDISALTI